MNERKHFDSAQVREILRSLKWSRAKLAKVLSRSESTVNKWCLWGTSNTTVVPTLERLLEKARRSTPDPNPQPAQPVSGAV